MPITNSEQARQQAAFIFDELKPYTSDICLMLDKRGNYLGFVTLEKDTESAEDIFDAAKRRKARHLVFVSRDHQPADWQARFANVKSFDVLDSFNLSDKPANKGYGLVKTICLSTDKR